MIRLNKVKSWAWWKIHEKVIMSLVGKAIKSLLHKLEDLEYVNFKFKGKVYGFSQSITQNKESL
jgi:hypothetical protein